jgi:hypothetical protein
MPRDMTVTSDLAEVEATLKAYFDGMYECDIEKLSESFHPQSHLYNVVDGKLIDKPLEVWLDIVRKRVPAASVGHLRTDRVLTIDFNGPVIAFAKVAGSRPGINFVDCLTLIKTGHKWQIIAKAFHMETRIEPA